LERKKADGFHIGKEDM